jgi:hypothetical protein
MPLKELIKKWEEVLEDQEKRVKQYVDASMCGYFLSEAVTKRNMASEILEDLKKLEDECQSGK